MRVSECDLRWRGSRRSTRQAAICAAAMSLPCRLAAQGLPPQASSPVESSPAEREVAPELEGSALESPSQPEPEAAGPRKPGAGDHSDAADFRMPHYDQGFVLVDPVDPERATSSWVMVTKSGVVDKSEVLAPTYPPMRNSDLRSS